MSDEQFFLANAYVDGELTDDERRTAEADPAVMAEVATLRALQARVRDTPPPSASARDTAVAAAMSEFTASSTDDRPVEPESPTVVPFRPRPAYARALGIAAAVVAVVGLGVVVSQVGTGGDDDASGAADVTLDAGDDAAREGALTESAQAVPEATAEESFDMAADDGGEESASVAAEMAGGDGDAADEMVEEAEVMSEEAGAEDTADSSAGAEADASPWSERLGLFDRPIAIPDGYERDALLLGFEDLALRGLFLVRERDEGRLPPSPNTECVPVGEPLARAEALFDDVVVVVIAVDEIERTVVAIDAASCEPLAVAPLPELDR